MIKEIKKAKYFEIRYIFSNTGKIVLPVGPKIPFNSISFRAFDIRKGFKDFSNLKDAREFIGA